jgi:hypothetical protein
VADEHTKSACAASQLAQGRENIACWSCLSILLVSKILTIFVNAILIQVHTVLQDLDLSGRRRCSESDGDDSGRCDSDRQERAHVEPHFILHVQATNVVDNTILSTAASSDKKPQCQTPQRRWRLWGGGEWAAGVNERAGSSKCTGLKG